MRRGPCVTVPCLLLALGCSREPAGAAPSPAPAPSSRAAAPPASAVREGAPPPGYREMFVGGVATTRNGDAVVLTDPARQQALLIFIGGTEALSIALRLRKERYERPLTHDLLDGLLAELHAELVDVRVDALEGEVFHGTVRVRSRGRLITSDARPSDAIALALGSEAPIYVASALIERVGIDLADVDVRAADAGPTERAVEERPGQVSL